MGKTVMTVVCAYLLVMAVMYFFQRNFMFHPGADAPGTPAASGVPEMKEIKVATDDGLSLLAWFAPPKKTGGRIIVLFHGNAGDVSHRAYKARQLLDKGYGVYLCEYRGYGGNPGSPSEQGFYKDARAGLKWLEAQGYDARNFVIYGESIGSGVAVQMALETQPKSLILEAPFTSAVDVAKGVYFWLPVDLLIKDRFDNITKLPDVKSSLLVIHGDADRVIPIDLSRRLFTAAAHGKKYVTIENGGHSDLYDSGAGKVVTDWLGSRP